MSNLWRWPWFEGGALGDTALKAHILHWGIRPPNDGTQHSSCSKQAVLCYRIVGDSTNTLG